MKLVSFLFTSVLIVIIGCAPSPEELGNTLTDSLVIEVFVDINLINARAELGYGNIDITLDSILSYHGLSQNEYDQQIDYYVRHPDTYTAVLNQVTQRMAEESRAISGF